MKNKFIKVDRVASTAEASALEALGVGIISVDLDLDARFSDQRTVTADQAAEIRATLRGATFAVAIDLTADPAELVHRARLAGASLIQGLTNAVPQYPVRAALRDAGIGIVYAGIEISHDDDPGWVFSAQDGAEDLNAAFYQVDVLPEYQDSWAFLRDQSPEYENEFQIEDLDELAGSRPLIAGLDLRPDNVAEIEHRLSRVRGLVLTLADRAVRTDVHFRSFAEAIAVLKAVRT
ncbi:hypothetical protein OHA21_27140 [Actinoplanes sp. NBC_00393]|uniref:hypothetical protein n=1 Tax=Actinoplanes sp. NBC_00393 TaxID=2975953 RepID=UPI002E1E8847